MTKNGKTQQSITYPISIDGYVKEWGTWDIVRELVSNALDTESTVSISAANGTLTIKDSGNGLSVKSLLMGMSEKVSDNSIGKFGEGMKLALLVGMRLEKKIEIFSKNLYFCNSKSDIMEYEVLKIDYKESPEILFDGTKVIIHNWNEGDYKDYFILSPEDGRIIYTNKYGMILKDTGKIFVRNVFVDDNKGYAYNYNLLGDVKINRDRNALDLYEINRQIGKIWTANENLSDWIDFWQACKDGKMEKMISLSRYDLSEKMKEIIKKSFTSIFGKNPILCYNAAEQSEMTHRGFTPITAGIFGQDIQSLLGYLFGYASDYLEDMRKKEIIWISSHKMSDTQKFTMSVLRKVCKRAGFDSKKLKGANLDNQKAAGLYVPSTGEIYIDIDVLNYLEYSISVLLHEIGHSVNNASDLTDCHVNDITNTSAHIVLSYAKHDY